MGKSISFVGIFFALLLWAGAVRADAVYGLGQLVHAKNYDYVVNRTWWQEPTQLGVDITVIGTLPETKVSYFYLINGQGKRIGQTPGPAGSGFVNAVGVPVSVVAGQQIRANIFFRVGPGMQWDLFDLNSASMNVVPRVGVVR